MAILFKDLALVELSTLGIISLPLTNVAPQSFNDLRNKIQEGKRQRAKEYRRKKKQQEKDWKINILSLESQNKSLKEEVARLKKEKTQILEDHAQILEDLNHIPHTTYHIPHTTYHI